MVIDEDQIHEDATPQMKGQFVVNRYSMFLPLNVDEIMSDYPELRKYDVFKRLFPKDVVFCWYMAHKSSPLHTLENKTEKITFAIKRSYPGLTSGPKFDKLMSGDFSEDMKEAMAQMSAFQPGVRARLKAINEKMLENWEKIAKKDLPEDMINDPDAMKKAKEYVEATDKIRKQMPELLNEVEKNYSLTEDITASEESETIGYLDFWHEEKSGKTAK